MVWKVRNRLMLTMAIIAGLALAGFYGYGLKWANAAPVVVASGVAAPTDGTVNSLNLTFQAQDWIGFYGNLSMQIVQNGSLSNFSLLNVTVKNGTMYITKAGEDPTFASSIVANATDPYTDGNFSLAGQYITSNMGFSNTTGMQICGVGSPSNAIWYVNTTDNIPVGLLRDGAGASANYYLCSKIYPQQANSNLHIAYQYAIIAPKTGTYGNTGYDLYYEGTIS